jgi:alpha,alpha-trehalose phosphorylase
MRDYGETLTFAPRLPSRLTRLGFGVIFQGRRLRVQVHAEEATYELLDGEPVELIHHGERVTVTSEVPLSCRIPLAPEPPAPQFPAGRAPASIA